MSKLTKNIFFLLCVGFMIAGLFLITLSFLNKDGHYIPWIAGCGGMAIIMYVIPAVYES